MMPCISLEMSWYIDTGPDGTRCQDTKHIWTFCLFECVCEWMEEEIEEILDDGSIFLAVNFFPLLFSLGEGEKISNWIRFEHFLSQIDSSTSYTSFHIQLGRLFFPSSFSLDSGWILDETPEDHTEWEEDRFFLGLISFPFERRRRRGFPFQRFIWFLSPSLIFYITKFTRSFPFHLQLILALKEETVQETVWQAILSSLSRKLWERNDLKSEWEEETKYGFSILLSCLVCRIFFFGSHSLLFPSPPGSLTCLFKFFDNKNSILTDLMFASFRLKKEDSPPDAPCVSPDGETSFSHPSVQIFSLRCHILLLPPLISFLSIFLTIFLWQIRSSSSPLISFPSLESHRVYTHSLMSPRVQTYNKLAFVWRLRLQECEKRREDLTDQSHHPTGVLQDYFHSYISSAGSEWSRQAGGKKEKNFWT